MRGASLEKAGKLLFFNYMKGKIYKYYKEHLLRGPCQTGMSILSNQEMEIEFSSEEHLVETGTRRK